MFRLSSLMTCLMMIVMVSMLVGCSMGGKRGKLNIPKDYPVYIHDVTNLSGVPLTTLDPDLFLADQLKHLPKATKSKRMSFPLLLKQALKVVLHDEGIVISEDNQERLQVHIAISEWSSEEAAKRGEVWVVVDAFLVDRIDEDEPIMEVRSARWHQLLEGSPGGEPILGPMRVISGAYQRMAIDIATDLLVKGRVIDPPFEAVEPKERLR